MIGRILVGKGKVHKDGHEEWDPWKRQYVGTLTLDGYLTSSKFIVRMYLLLLTLEDTLTYLQL